MSKKINIAIDGYSSCGKGTLARMLAKSLSYIFIDSGAMYRAVTLAVMDNHISPENTLAVGNLLPQLEIGFRYEPASGTYHTLLNGTDIEDRIRTMEVSEMVSPVSRIPAVREFLTVRQRQIGADKGVVMDGRDIGTVVFPDAELKIFMTARPEIRARRRYEELKAKGIDTTFEEVLGNINSRDSMDTTRANSPLRPAPDAFILDNSELSRDEQFEIALSKANGILKAQ